ncbi:hypothetical protein niasHS_008208 [Heterodera schachtii]|uniref:Kinesin motor domain-containing protein n=1 Tax=Heterodera schachtii TaxID=97005 RepID=A0ABD2J5G1_HETSC
MTVRRASSSVRIKKDTTSQEISLLVTLSRNVTSQADILSALATGAQNRTTAATNMNNQSSSSHAIFTLNIKQARVVLVELQRISEMPKLTVTGDIGREPGGLPAVYSCLSSISSKI